MKYFLLLYLFLKLNGFVAAQQKEFVFKNFTQEEGLPSNETYYIFEDSKHYLWVATDLGVVRYDGNKFEQFNLPHNVIFRISEDNKGRIWFFSLKGLLACFENEKLYPYKYNTEIAARIGKLQIIDATVGDNGYIYMNSTLDSNYIITDKGEITSSGYDDGGCQNAHISIEPTSRGPLVSKILRRNQCTSDSLYFHIAHNTGTITYQIPVKYPPFTHFESVYGSDGTIYAYAGKYLFQLNKNSTFRIKEFPEKILSLLPMNGQLYVGLLKTGLIILDPELAEKSNSSILLPDKSVTCIRQDYEGGIWISTLESGLFYIKNTNIYKYNVPDEKPVAVSRTLNIRDNILLYSTSEGLYKIANGKSEIILKAKNTNINGLYLDNRSILYYTGAFDSLSIIRVPKNPYLKYINIMSVTSPPVIFRNDSIFVGRPTSVVAYKSTFLSGHMKTLRDEAYFTKWKTILPKPAKLLLDQSNNLWAATNDGLYKATASYDTMLKFVPHNKLLNAGVNTLKQMNNGLLVAGIQFSGIVVIKDTSIMAHITEKQGLLSNKIRHILVVGDNLWVATAKGISIIQFSSFDTVRYKISNISKDDGFYNLTINQLETFQHNIVAATSNGLFFIENPELFLRRKLPPVPFHIKNISYYNGDTTGISSITLPYSKKRLVIKYTAVSFSSYETVTYLYQFKDTDTTWQRTSNTELLLENLEPGNYQLRIKAFIPNQNRYSAEQRLLIIIEKPWWQNNWVRVFFILLTAAIVYLLVSKRIKKIQAEEKRKTELNAKLTELEQTALRSQMNPHFIFNCLTSIQQLIISGNKVDANEYLVKFSRLIRTTLEMSAQPFISIREEKEYLEEYLFLEQLRLAGKFGYTVTADESVNMDEIFIPNMMVQPIVENCVRHGIKALENKTGIINVTFSRYGKVITCIITDNGIGRNNAADFNQKNITKHKSYGMDIVRKRLETFSEFNLTGTGVEIRDRFDEEGLPAGTEVILHLPYKTHL